MVEQVKRAERVVLAVAVTLLPLLVAFGLLSADQAATAGAVLTSLSAGLRLPAAADTLTRTRSGLPRGKRRQQALETEISDVAQRIVAQLRAREQTDTATAVDNAFRAGMQAARDAAAADAEHGGRPSS